MNVPIKLRGSMGRLTYITTASGHYAGLSLLIATPVVRVAVSIAVFLLEKDRKFVIITLLVMAILLFSMFVVGNLVPKGVHSDMNGIHFSLFVILFIFLGSIAAGLLGSLVGLGGGVLIVPILTLIFGLPIYFAIGASIISVIATSTGAAAAYVRDHMTNMRLGMFLEIATTTGAICGAFLAGMLAPELLSVIFGIILLVFCRAACLQNRRRAAKRSKK